MAGLRFRHGFEFYQVPGFYRLDPLAGGIMVLVGGFGAYQLDFRLGVPVGGNGFCLAGRGAGHGAFLGAKTSGRSRNRSDFF